MENILERFPVVAKKIFCKLDDESLVQAKEVCRPWRYSIDSQKLSWIRKIQSDIIYKQEFTRHWPRVLVRMSVETVKELSMVVYQFYQFKRSRYYKNNWSPLHITAEQDKLSLSQHVMSSQVRGPPGFFSRLHWKFLAQNLKNLRITI